MLYHELGLAKRNGGVSLVWVRAWVRQGSRGSLSALTKSNEMNGRNFPQEQSVYLRLDEFPGCGVVSAKLGPSWHSYM